MIFLRLFWEFFQTGLFSIGGGLATLPFLYSMGDRTGWFTSGDVADMLAVSESTPGPIGVNMATYVGFRCSSGRWWRKKAGPRRRSCWTISLWDSARPGSLP